jgi:hypothetical protein
MINWERIETFIGFGRHDAPVVFIGMEEGLRSRDELNGDLLIRSSYDRAIMDLKEAHRGIAGTERYLDPDRAPVQRTWRVMADLMLRLGGMTDPSKEDRRRYQTLRLGRSDGETLLTEFLPYPSPGVRDWLYERYGRYNTRETYIAEMLPLRLNLLRSVLAEAPRELVVCYGKTHWWQYECLFPDTEWCTKDKYRVGEGESTRIVLAPHFVSRGFNSDADLVRLAEVAFEGSGGSATGSP